MSLCAGNQVTYKHQQFMTSLNILFSWLSIVDRVHFKLFFPFIFFMVIKQEFHCTVM